MKLFEIEKCDAAIEHYKKSCGFLRRGRINSFFFGGQAGIGSYQQDIQVLIILVHGDVNKAMSQERRQAGHFHEQKTNHRDFDSQDFELIKLSLRQNTIAKRASNQAFAILIKHIKAKLGIFVWILLKNMTSEKQLTDEVLLNILNNRDKVEQYFLTQNLLKTNVLCNDWASVESDFIQRHDIDVAIGDVAFVFNADDFEAELETKILENPLHKSAKEIIAYH